MVHHVMAITTPLLHKSVQHLDPVAVFQHSQHDSDPSGGVVTLVLQDKAQLAAQIIPGGLILSLDHQPLPKKRLTVKHPCITQLLAVVTSRVYNKGAPGCQP